MLFWSSLMLYALGGLSENPLIGGHTTETSSLMPDLERWSRNFEYCSKLRQSFPLSLHSAIHTSRVLLYSRDCLSSSTLLALGMSSLDHLSRYLFICGVSKKPYFMTARGSKYQ